MTLLQVMDFLATVSCAVSCSSQRSQIVIGAKTAEGKLETPSVPQPNGPSLIRAKSLIKWTRWNPSARGASGANARSALLSKNPKGSRVKGTRSGNKKFMRAALLEEFQ